MKIKLLELMQALYAPCDRQFGYQSEAGSIVLQNASLTPDSHLDALSLPHYSPAYERQRFLDAYRPDGQQRQVLLERFGLSDVQFAPERTPEQDAREEAWLQVCREMFVALNIEEQFQDYLFCIGLSKALLWCAENGCEKDPSGIDRPCLQYFSTPKAVKSWDALKAEYFKCLK